MAHHLAELLVRAKSAKGVEKEAAEDRVSQVILGLWAQRHCGNRQLDPMTKYVKAAEVLAAIHPSNGRFAIWDHPGAHGRASLTLQVFDIAAKLALFEIVELIQDLPIEVAKPVAEFLSKEEKNYLEAVRKARDQLAALTDVRLENNEELHVGYPDLHQGRCTLFERLQLEMVKLSTNYPSERGGLCETDDSAPPNDNSVSKPASIRRVRSSKKRDRDKASE